jgi:hypothetical protein
MWYEEKFHAISPALRAKFDDFDVGSIFCKLTYPSYVFCLKKTIEKILLPSFIRK